MLGFYLGFAYGKINIPAIPRPSGDVVANDWCITFCILIYFPIQINTLRMGLSIIYFKGSQVEISNQLRMFPKIVFILANSADPDEMQHYWYATFHLGLHDTPKYPLGVCHIQRVNLGL